MFLLKELKQKCLNDNIPIIRDNTIDLIANLITSSNYQSILELGTAYGYSAYLMSLIKNANITTIEKDKKRYEIACNFLKHIKNIKTINDDIFIYEPIQKFDFILVDGPKSNQEDIVKKYYEYLNKNGTMVIDNIYLKKISEKINLTPNQQKLINKVNNFRK
jgi:predicted O-methyltransferase YrrM